MNHAPTSRHKHVVLVTRPQRQASEFMRLLASKGIASLAFPSIEIQSVELDARIKKILHHLNDYDLIIFISANAVEQASQLMQQLGIAPASITTKMATIGKATLAAANKAGFKISISPANKFNSEALLALNELQTDVLKNKRSLIFRGVGGLDVLANELQQRGAKVSYAEVYQRIKPQHDGQVSRQQLSENWQNLHIKAITVTSNEALQNLYDMLEPPGKNEMLKTPLIVASARGVALAKKLQFKQVQSAQSAMNQHMLNALEKEFAIK